MTFKMKNWFLPFLFLCVCFTGLVQAEEEIQTFMTFSASSWNSVINDLKTIGETASNPAFAAMVEGPARFFLGKKVMKAADLNAPIGVALQNVKGSEKQEAMLIFCIPVKDPMLVVELLAQRTGRDPDATKSEDGIIRWGGQFLKEINGFTWFATDERQLAQIDSVDPKTFFGLKDGQSFQLTFDFQAFPEIYTKYVKAYDEGIELALEKEEDESDEAFDLRKKSAEEQKEQMLEILQSLQLYTMGFSVNPTEKCVETHITVSFKPDSDASRLLKKAREAKKMFTGFAQASGQIYGYGVRVGLPNAPEFQETQLKMALESLHQVLGEKERAFLGKELVEPILNEMLNQTETFSGYVLDGKKGAHNLVFAVSTNQLVKIQELCEKSMELAKQKLGEKFKDEWFQNDVQAHGMTFSRLTAPSDEFLRVVCENVNEKYDEKELQAFKTWFGETFTFVVGGKENRLFVGLGNDPLTKLGECLNDQPVGLLSETVLDLRGIFRYIEEFVIFAQENDLVKAKVQIKTEALPAPDEQGVANTAEKSGEEIAEEVVEEKEDEFSEEESESDLKKIESKMGVLLEMLADTEKTKVRVMVDSTENEVQVKILGEEGVLKIIGMLPGLIMMQAF